MKFEDKQNRQLTRSETAVQEEERLKREHEWRQILQQQFAELWFRLNIPKKTEVKLEKIRGTGGKTA